MQLEGRAALVTGAGQGVGRGIALALASEGCAVAVAGRTEAKLRDACGDIEGRGGAPVALVGPDLGYLTGSTLMLDGGQAFLR